LPPPLTTTCNCSILSAVAGNIPLGNNTTGSITLSTRGSCNFIGLSSETIDDVFQLSTGRFPGSGSTGITWNLVDSTLTIVLDTAGGGASIEEGDTVTFAPTGRKIVVRGPGAFLSYRHVGADVQTSRIRTSHGRIDFVLPERFSVTGKPVIVDMQGRTIASCHRKGTSNTYVLTANLPAGGVYAAIYASDHAVHRIPFTVCE